jgi:flagellar basal body-associated protein FliL
MRRVMLLLLTLWSVSCGGEDVLGGAAAGTGGSSSVKTKAVEPQGEGYCVNTFQVDLADNSGQAMIRVCLSTNEETTRYIQKHDSYAEAIRQRFVRIVQSNSLDELEMPGAQGRIQQEMLAAVQEQVKPLSVEGVDLQRFELW